MRTCDELDCSNQVVAWGWCQKHYWRWRKTGSPDLTLVRTTGDWEYLLRRALEGGIRCIEVNNKTRPNIRLDNKMHSASRVVWIKKYGNPGKLSVLHTCNNDQCINIDHLYADTHQRNMQDMANNGSQKGSRNPRAKLREGQVARIRSLAGIKSHSQIARLFGVTQPTITYIIQGKTWSHVKLKEAKEENDSIHS